jgi:nitrogen fixation/metabolism regulation signal transduction histidine kinase
MKTSSGRANVQLDPRNIRQQVENLKLIHPELLEDDEAWIASLESETDFNEILTTIVRRIEDTKALVIGTKDRFEELKARKDRFEHRIETLRTLAFKIMAAAELAKCELPEATLSLRAGTQQLVGDADPATLPDSLCIITRAFNRAAIKEALKAGGAVPGFELSNSSPSLSIRIK